MSVSQATCFFSFTNEVELCLEYKELGFTVFGAGFDSSCWGVGCKVSFGYKYSRDFGLQEVVKQSLEPYNSIPKAQT